MSKKAKQSKGPRKGSFLDRYNARETKGSWKNTFIKTGGDAVTGAIVGTGIGALAGKYAILVGPALVITGHYTGDKSGLLRIAGASTMAYGIACALANQEISGTVDGISLAGETSKVKARMENWKEQMKVAFFLEKIFKKGDGGTDAVGAIDLSALDVFDDFNQLEAEQYEATRGYSEEQPYTLPDFSSNAPTRETSFAIIDEDPDLTEI